MIQSRYLYSAKRLAGSLARPIAAAMIAGLLMVSCSGGGSSTSYGSGSNGTVGSPSGTSLPGTFSLSSPANLATGVSITPNFVWTASSGATSYAVNLKAAAGADFTQLAAVTAPTTNFQTASALLPATVYNWQVIALNTAGSATAGPWSFTTASSTVSAALVEVVACPATGTTDVAIQNFAFSPGSITIPAASIVKWSNLDTITHTVTSTAAPANGTFDTLVNAGTSVCLKFTAAGSYSYHCSIHSFMTGAVTVQ
jgi:plastocyanin